MAMTKQEKILWEIMSVAEMQSVIYKLQKRISELCQAKNYIDARTYAQILIGRDDAWGMASYGQMLHHGLGGAVDLMGARKWYLEAANKGDDFAKLNLFVLCKQGKGGEIDFCQVQDWVQAVETEEIK